MVRVVVVLWSDPLRGSHGAASVNQTSLGSRWVTRRWSRTHWGGGRLLTLVNSAKAWARREGGYVTRWTQVVALARTSVGRQ